MSFSRICWVGLLLLLLISQSILAKSIYQQAKIYFESAEKLDQLKQMHLDIVGEGEDYLEIVIFPDKLEALNQLGFNSEIVIEDMTAFFQSRLDPSRDMGGYKTLQEDRSIRQGGVHARRRAAGIHHHPDGSALTVSTRPGPTGRGG